jgi:hypothetical protein
VWHTIHPNSSLPNLNNHMKSAKVRMNWICHRWQFWRFFVLITVMKVFLLLWKFFLSKWSLDTKMKVRVKSHQLLHVVKVKIIIIDLYNHLINKSKISIVILVWPWNIGQRSNTCIFPDSLGMTSFTLAILFFALKPMEKNLFSI